MIKLFTILAIFISFPVLGQTNVTNVETNLNQVVIDILSDSRVIGKEVYNASKQTISKSIDFVIKETPDVVNQFLKWKFLEATIKCAVVSLPLIVMWFIAYLIYRKLKKTSDDGFEFTPLIVMAIITLTSGPIWYNGIVTNGLNAVKIKVAPKVYLIEYVANYIKK